MSRYEYAPGLYFEDKIDTYFSLLPVELLKLLTYYYYFPIQIHFHNYKLNDGIVTLLVSRVAGPRTLESININVGLKDLIFFFQAPATIVSVYKPHNTKLILYDNILTIMLISGNDNTIIYYDKYETKYFLQKLEFLQSQLGKYLNLGLSEREVNIKISKYTY